MTLDDANRKWVKNCLRPTGLGVSKWEAEAQNVGNGVRHWATNLNTSLKRIGANPGPQYLDQYLTRTSTAAADRRYSNGIEKAAREDKWKTGFLRGINR